MRSGGEGPECLHVVPRLLHHQQEPGAHGRPLQVLHQPGRHAKGLPGGGLARADPAGEDSRQGVSSGSGVSVVKLDPCSSLSGHS